MHFYSRNTLDYWLGTTFWSWHVFHVLFETAIFFCMVNCGLENAEQNTDEFILRLMNSQLQYQEGTNKLIIATTGGIGYIYMSRLVWKFWEVGSMRSAHNTLQGYWPYLRTVILKAVKPIQDSTCQISDTVSTVTSLSQSKHYLIKGITWKYQSSRSLQTEEVKSCHWKYGAKPFHGGRGKHGCHEFKTSTFKKTKYLCKRTSNSNWLNKPSLPMVHRIQHWILFLLV